MVTCSILILLTVCVTFWCVVTEKINKIKLNQTRRWLFLMFLFKSRHNLQKQINAIFKMNRPTPVLTDIPLSAHTQKKHDLGK